MRNNNLHQSFDFSEYKKLTIIELTGNEGVKEVIVANTFKLNQDKNSNEQPKYFCLVESSTKIKQNQIKH